MTVELRDWIFVKGYVFLWEKLWVKKISKSVRNKYTQKLLDNAKQSATETFKTASKRAIQKTAKTTDDLIGNKISDRITKASKTIGFFKERYISLEQEK